MSTHVKDLGIGEKKRKRDPIITASAWSYCEALSGRATFKFTVRYWRSIRQSD